MSNSVNIGLNMTGNIVDRFSQLSDKVQEVEKSIKKLGPEFKNLAGTGIGSNPKLHSIVSGTDFKGGFDGILKSIKKNKIKAYDGGILGQKELAGILDTRNALKSAQLGAKASGYKDIEKMLKAPVERYEALLKAMDVSLTRVKAMDLKDGDLKSTEKAIKKFVDDANKLILTTENSFNGMGKTAAGAFKKAKPKRAQDEWKNDVRTKDFSYSSKRYKNDQEYRRHVDNALNYYQMKAGNYGTIGESALTNASLKAGKMFGNTNTQYNGFFQELGQGLTNGINEGFKNFNLGELLSGTIKKGGTFRRQNKILEKLGYESDFLGMTDAFQNTKSFKEFADKKRAEMGEFGKNWDNKSIFSAFKGTDEFKELTKKVKENKEIDFSQLSSQDRSKVLAGLANNKQAAGMMGGLKMGGVFLATAAGVTKLAEAALNLGKEAVRAYEGVEQLKTQLGVVFGSSVQSDAAFSEIETYAKKSPFGVENMTQQAILLKQSGVYASDLMNTLKRIGDISSGNNEKMKSMSQVYARVMSSQTVTARDMRQLSTAGVPSYAALADSMGIDRGQIRRKLQAGQVSYTDFQKMIESLTSEGGMFYGATEIGAKTLAARKQNLSDANQMAKANIGELLLRQNPLTLLNPVLASLGLGANKTGRVEDGWYGQVLGWLEKINGTIERSAEYANKKMDVEVPEKIKEEYNKQMAIVNDSSKSELQRSIAAEEAKKLADSYSVSVGKSYSSQDWLYNQVTSEDKAYVKKLEEVFGMSITSIEQLEDQLKYIDFAEKGSYIDENGKLNLRDDFQTLFEEFKANEKAKKHDTQASAMTAEAIQKAQALGLTKSTGATVNDSSLDQVRYKIGHYFSEIVKATQKGVDEMDAQIQNTKDTFDKFGNVNFGKKGLDGYGAQHLMNAAIDDYHNNSPVWQMSWKDQKAYWDEQAKKEIDSYSAKTKKGKDKNGKDIYDFTGLNIEDFVRAQDVLTSSSEAIGLLAHPENATDIMGHMTEAGAKDVNAFLDNLKELAQVAENSGGKELFGKDFTDGMEKLTNLLGDKHFGDHAVENVKEVVRLLNEDLIAGLKTQMAGLTWENNPEQKAKLEAMLKAVEQSMSVKEHNDDTSGINARKQATLRSHVISQITGVSAERVDNTWQKNGQNASMNAYLNNFSQRQTFAQLGKVLMQNGAELKDVARAMQEGKNGQKYGMYDWNKSTSSIEEQAAQKNIATQEALISAYQQQIDALQELTVGSIATRDQWDNLGSLSAQLGVAFELSAKTLADGTVQFTDATIQAAHKMLEELDFKKFKQQLDTITNRTIEKERTEMGGAKVKTAILEGKVGGTGYYSVEEAAKLESDVNEKIAEIKKATDSTLKKNLEEISGRVYNNKDEANAALRQQQTVLSNYNLPSSLTIEEISTANIGKVTQMGFESVDETVNKSLREEYEKSGSKKSFFDWAKEPIYNKKYNDKQTRYANRYRDKLIDAGYENKKFNTVYTDGKFRLKSWNYQDISRMEKGADVKSSSGKTGYIVKGFSNQSDDLIKNYKEDLKSGKYSEGTLGLTTMMGDLNSTQKTLTETIRDNTESQDHRASVEEMRNTGWQMREYLGSHGVLGTTEEERKRNKELMNDKPVSELDSSNPLLSSINSWIQDSILESLNFDRNFDYKEFRQRRVNDILRETPDGKVDFGEYNKNVQDYLTSSAGRSSRKDLYKKLKTPEGLEALKENTNFSDDMKSQLSGGLGSFNDALKNMDLSQFVELLNLTTGIKEETDEIGKSWQENTEISKLNQDKLKNLGNTIKDEIGAGLKNSLNTGLTKAGDLAYKLQNNLIEGADATMEMKKALAGVAATMLENIGASMTETGLSIAAGAAKTGSWGMVAAGLALAAAGGAASFGGGMLSAFASDNNKGDSSEAEDQLARLEDLKDNLAELLKQAKDDAIYYETNLRQKQAVAFNDAVSSTNVNDAIITPRGVVNTAPDDYIMAMKDPTHLLGKGGGGTNVSFSIVNESGTPMTVTSSETRQNGDTTEITAIVNAIVQKSMNDGEYDDVMAGMQVRQRGSQISS